MQIGENIDEQNPAQRTVKSLLCNAMQGTSYLILCRSDRSSIQSAVVLCRS